MADPSTRRVVVTGRGAVTPIGASWEQTWANLVAGVSGIGPVTSFETADLPVRIGAEVRDFDPAAYLPHRLARRLDSSVQIALVAAIQAMRDAKLEIDEAMAPRVATFVGTAAGPTKATWKAHNLLNDQGVARLSPYFFASSGVDSAVGEIALFLGAQGNAISMSTACATGATCIGEAMRLIRGGHADVVVAGGGDDNLTRLDLAGAAVSGALSRRNDDPAAACRPFDRDRDGFVMGAGAGVLVLESAEHALSRGARVLAELCGYGATTDAYHPTAPQPEGLTAQRAMREALADAGEAIDAVDYINAHGTGTLLNDTTEVKAIRGVFGPAATGIPVSSLKSMTGHMLGGSGAVEYISCIETINTGLIPPTLNCENPEDDDMDFVVGTTRRHRVDLAMSNSFGFGGHNVALIARRWSS